MVTLLLLMAAQAVEPSAQAMKLGRQIAESGTLASLLPLMKQKETDELVAAHPGLTSEEKAKLRVTAASVFESGRERVMHAEAKAFAQRLSVADMRAIIAFQATGASKRQRAAMPEVIVDTMKLVGKMDFKGEVLAAYCKDTGKLCGK